MLNKKALGAAIAAAIKLKIERGYVVSQAEIAKHFGIKPPSLSGWKKTGAIDKEKLPELFRYFSDVVSPDHWGLKKTEWQLLASAPKIHSETANYDARLSREESMVLTGFRAATPEVQAIMLDIAKNTLRAHDKTASVSNSNVRNPRAKTLALTDKTGDLLESIGVTRTTNSQQKTHK